MSFLRAEQSAATADVVKQILDKFTDAAKAAQTTVEGALPHVIRAYAARQIGYLLVGVLLVLLGGVVAARVFRPGAMFKNDEPTWRCALLGCGVMIWFAGVIIFLANLGDTLAVLIDPLGAFMLGLLGK